MWAKNNTGLYSSPSVFKLIVSITFDVAVWKRSGRSSCRCYGWTWRRWFPWSWTWDAKTVTVMSSPNCKFCSLDFSLWWGFQCIYQWDWNDQSERLVFWICVAFLFESWSVHWLVASFWIMAAAYFCFLPSPFVCRRDILYFCFLSCWGNSKRQ